MIILSGIFLGLAILTKVPAFTLIPVVSFLILRKTRKNVKALGLWFIPVILIPSLWPAYAIFNGELSEWVQGFLWQATGRIERPLSMALEVVYRMDPVIVVLGIAGLVFAAIKRDFLILLWSIPFLLFLQWIGYVSYWFFIPMIPILCIGGGRLIVHMTDRIRHTTIHKTLIYFAVLSICLFGLVSTTVLIGSNVNSAYFQTVAASHCNSETTFYADKRFESRYR